MKILIVHNYYGSEAPSGENSVVDTEIKLLKKYGNEVEVYSRSSDEIRSRGLIGKIIGGVSTIFNIFEYFKFKNKLKEFKPNVIHIHNTFPLISPSILFAITSDTPIFVTLHNYRFFCSSGIPSRNGKICTLCIDKKNVIYSLLNKCYRNSLLATLPISFSISVYRKLNLWNNKVTNFIVLSEFHKNMFIKAGISESKIRIKPNFYSGSPNVVNFEERNIDVIFVGRLTSEKGVFTLLNAWKIMGNQAPRLSIIGEGPLRNELEKYSIDNNLQNVFFHGIKSQNETEQFISRSKLLILPSECYEGFPMVIREAFAWGTPVAASDLGSLSEIVNDEVNGVLFESGNSESIANKIMNLIYDVDKLKLFSNNATNKFLKLYTEEINYNILTNIYLNKTDI